MKKEKSPDRFQKCISIIAIVIFLLLTIAVFFFIGIPLVRYAKEPEKFRLWVDDHGLSGRLMYIGMVFIQVIVAIIPGEPFEILGGYAFGIVEGSILALTASSLGSIAVFLFVRKWGMRLVEVFFSKEKVQSLRFLRSSPKRDYIYLIIFMIPGTPKDLLSYFAGLTDMRLSVWILICSFGRIPSIVTSAAGGGAIGTKNYLAAVIVFAATLAVSAVGVAIYHHICKKKQVERH